MVIIEKKVSITENKYVTHIIIYVWHTFLKFVLLISQDSNDEKNDDKFKKEEKKKEKSPKKSDPKEEKS